MTPESADALLEKKHYRGRWTPDEDEKLRSAVVLHEGKSWKKIAQTAFGEEKTDVQCLHRWQKVLRPGLVKGPWLPHEDAMVASLVRRYGLKKWSLVASHLKGRLGKQCRERWYNHLDPDIKKDAWTPEEDNMLIQAQRELGNKWAQIAARLPGRTDNSVKNRWNSTLQRIIHHRDVTNLTASTSTSSSSSSASPKLNPRSSSTGGSSTVASISSPNVSSSTSSSSTVANRTMFAPAVAAAAAMEAVLNLPLQTPTGTQLSSQTQTSISQRIPMGDIAPFSDKTPPQSAKAKEKGKVSSRRESASGKAKHKQSKSSSKKEFEPKTGSRTSLFSPLPKDKDRSLTPGSQKKGGRKSRTPSTKKQSHSIGTPLKSGVQSITRMLNYGDENPEGEVEEDFDRNEGIPTNVPDGTPKKRRVSDVDKQLPPALSLPASPSAMLSPPPPSRGIRGGRGSTASYRDFAESSFHSPLSTTVRRSERKARPTARFQQGSRNKSLYKPKARFELESNNNNDSPSSRRKSSQGQKSKRIGVFARIKEEENKKIPGQGSWASKSSNSQNAQNLNSTRPEPTVRTKGSFRSSGKEELNSGNQSGNGHQSDGEETNNELEEDGEDGDDGEGDMTEDDENGRYDDEQVGDEHLRKQDEPQRGDDQSCNEDDDDNDSFSQQPLHPRTSATAAPFMSPTLSALSSAAQAQANALSRLSSSPETLLGSLSLSPGLSPGVLSFSPGSRRDTALSATSSLFSPGYMDELRRRGLVEVPRAGANRQYMHFKTSNAGGYSNTRGTSQTQSTLGAPPAGLFHDDKKKKKKKQDRNKDKDKDDAGSTSTSSGASSGASSNNAGNRQANSRSTRKQVSKSNTNTTSITMKEEKNSDPEQTCSALDLLISVAASDTTRSNDPNSEDKKKTFEATASSGTAVRTKLNPNLSGDGNNKLAINYGQSEDGLKLLLSAMTTTTNSSTSHSSSSLLSSLLKTGPVVEVMSPPLTFPSSLPSSSLPPLPSLSQPALSSPLLSALMSPSPLSLLSASSSSSSPSPLHPSSSSLITIASLSSSPSSLPLSSLSLSSPLPSSSSSSSSLSASSSSTSPSLVLFSSYPSTSMSTSMSASMSTSISTSVSTSTSTSTLTSTSLSLLQSQTQYQTQSQTRSLLQPFQQQPRPTPPSSSLSSHHQPSELLSSLPLNNDLVNNGNRSTNFPANFPAFPTSLSATFPATLTSPLTSPLISPLTSTLPLPVANLPNLPINLLGTRPSPATFLNNISIANNNVQESVKHNQTTIDQQQQHHLASLGLPSPDKQAFAKLLIMLSTASSAAPLTDPSSNSTTSPLTFLPIDDSLLSATRAPVREVLQVNQLLTPTKARHNNTHPSGTLKGILQEDQLAQPVVGGSPAAANNNPSPALVEAASTLTSLANWPSPVRFPDQQASQPLPFTTLLPTTTLSSPIRVATNKNTDGVAALTGHTSQSQRLDVQQPLECSESLDGMFEGHDGE